MPLLHLILPRFIAWIVFSVIALAALYHFHPTQFEVALYKLALIVIAAVIGYWLDRTAFPYARPDGYLKDFWQKGTKEPLDAADYEVVQGYQKIFAAAMLRRALIMAAVVIGFALGL